jgi:iron-sulfur cluster repair protein YtfE (RIC family)
MSTITIFLKKDRQLCDHFLDLADNAVKRQFWRKAGATIDRFAVALYQHMAMEEGILFTALAQYTSEANRPIADLLLEHRQLRRLAICAASAVRRRNAADFKHVAAALRGMMEEHCMKEERILLTMADHLLRPAARFLVEAMQRLKSQSGAGCFNPAFALQTGSDKGVAVAPG